MERKIKCNYCGGSGKSISTPGKPCPACAGTGEQKIQTLS